MAAIPDNSHSSAEPNQNDTKQPKYTFTQVLMEALQPSLTMDVIVYPHPSCTRGCLILRQAAQKFADYGRGLRRRNERGERTGGRSPREEMRIAGASDDQGHECGCGCPPWGGAAHPSLRWQGEHEQTAHA